MAQAEIKDVRIPVVVQRPMAAEAEAAREAKAKVRSTAMSTPSSSHILVPGIQVPVCFLLIVKVDFHHYASQHHFYFSYSAGCGSRGKMNASKALKQASMVLAESPAGLQLHYLQTLTTLAAENNSTIVFPLPINVLESLGQKNRGG